MTEMTPTFEIRVWEHTSDASARGKVRLFSPQRIPMQPHDSMILRQVNWEPMDKAFVSRYALRFYPRVNRPPNDIKMDDAHAVVLRNGDSMTIPQGDEPSVPCKYTRGNRVWIEGNIQPSRKIDHENKNIPVIDLDTFQVYEIPFDCLCFVPRHREKETGNSEAKYAVCVSPNRIFMVGNTKKKAKLYIQWSLTCPDRPSFVWVISGNTVEGHEASKESFTLTGRAEKLAVFGFHWTALSNVVAQHGLLRSNNEAPRQLSVIPEQIQCNPAPSPAFENPGLVLVGSSTDGYTRNEHHYTEEGGIDECTRGVEYQNHYTELDDAINDAYTGQFSHTFWDPQDHFIPTDGIHSAETLNACTEGHSTSRVEVSPEQEFDAFKQSINSTPLVHQPMFFDPNTDPSQAMASMNIDPFSNLEMSLDFSSFAGEPFPVSSMEQVEPFYPFAAALATSEEETDEHFCGVDGLHGQ